MLLVEPGSLIGCHRNRCIVGKGNKLKHQSVAEQLIYFIVPPKWRGPVLGSLLGQYNVNQNLWAAYLGNIM